VISRPRIYALLAVLAFAALPAVGAPRPPDATGAQTSTLPPNFMGMAIRDPWYEFNTNRSFPNAPNQSFQDEMGATLARAGVRWVRFEFHIPVNITATQAISAEIGKNDYFIKEVAPRYGFKVLGLLGFDLLRGTEATLLNTGPFTVTSRYGGGVNQYMDTWLTRALMIADHYRDSVAAYEILNEENRLPPNGQAITPQIMGRLQTKFYRFCKNIDPSNEDHGCSNTQIILGGIHPRGTTNGLTDSQYLQAIYRDPSFGDFHTTHGYYPVDGVAYHPYPEEIKPTISDAQVNRGLLRMRLALETIATAPDKNDPCRQFWITEVGYNVGFDPDGPQNPEPAQTEQGQADFLRDVYTSLAQRRLDPQLCGADQPEVANVFWFKYEDFPPAETIDDNQGNPKIYAQKWGIVRIPILSDGGCEGGCYDPSGVPLFYRQSFWVYRELAELPVYRTYLPTVGQ